MRLRLAFFLVILPLACAHAEQPECAHGATPSQVDSRVDSLIAKMTPAEKISQLGDRAAAIPRLGILGYNWWNEGLHGIARNGYATVFPQAIGLAATWDVDLLQAVGEVVSTEARVKAEVFAGHDSPRYAGLTIWSPNVNIFRDPRWGRGQETYGEDPFLTGRLSISFVRGIQGGDPFYRRADATPKHFAVHSGPESGRDSFNAVVSQHDLNDTYFSAFRAIVKEAHPAALMCSYNAINGTPSCANGPNLQGVVRDRWGFDGYVVSDCDAVGNLNTYHHFADSSSAGAALALKAGVDLDCGSTYNSLGESLQTKLIREQMLDESLRRLFKARIQLGNLTASDCSPYGGKHTDETANGALAERAAEESMVLLKNDGTLPLQAKRKIAVVGPTANLLEVLEANYHGTAKHPVTLLDGMEQAFGPISYAQGSVLADGLTIPVPRTALRSGSQQHLRQGLHAEYFNSESLTGIPSIDTTVPQVEFDLDRAGPHPAITAKHYAARWSGSLQTPAGGDYVLKVAIERCWDCTTHDKYSLSIDGKQVLASDGHAPSADSVTIHDSGTKSHAIKLELIHTGEDEGISLEWAPPAQALLGEAIETARSADVVVACVGLSPNLEGEALSTKLDGFVGGDRTTLDLPKAQAQLLRSLRTLGKPVVLVVTSGSAVSLQEFAPNAAAVLQAWYPGQSGGTALGRILAGLANPSGRLPVTVYRTVDDLPAFSDYSMSNRTYRYFHGAVEFPFGYGLSYSTFHYENAKLSDRSLQVGSTITATTQVTNTGERAADEVVQLYVKAMQTEGAPRLSLKGFQRITLRPHESRTVTFRVPADAFSTVGADGQRLVAKDVYRIFIRGSQPDPDASGEDVSVPVGWLVNP